MSEVRKAHLKLLLPHYPFPLSKNLCGIDNFGGEMRTEKHTCSSCSFLFYACQQAKLPQFDHTLRMERKPLQQVLLLGATFTISSYMLDSLLLLMSSSFFPLNPLFRGGGGGKKFLPLSQTCTVGLVFLSWALFVVYDLLTLRMNSCLTDTCVQEFAPAYAIKINLS